MTSSKVVSLDGLPSIPGLRKFHDVIVSRKVTQQADSFMRFIPLIPMFLAGIPGMTEWLASHADQVDGWIDRAELAMRVVSTTTRVTVVVEADDASTTVVMTVV